MMRCVFFNPKKLRLNFNLCVLGEVFTLYYLDIYSRAVDTNKGQYYLY